MKLPFAIPKGVEQTAVTVGGNLVATGISSVALIIISRYLGPTAFGEFSVGFALVMILIKLNDLGLNTAIFAHVNYQSPANKNNQVIASITATKLILSVILLIVGVGGYLAFGHLLKLAHPEIILVGVLFSIVTMLFEHLIAVLQSLHLFSQAVAIYLTQSLAKLAIAGALLVQLPLSMLTTFTLYSLAPVASFVVAALVWPKKITLVPWLGKVELAKQTLATAKHTAVNTISQSLVDNLSIFFVQAYLSSFETGLLGGVSKIVLLFSLISYFLGQVLFPRVAHYQTVADRSRYLKKALGLTGLILLSTVVVIPLAPLSIILTIGASFMPGLPILQLLLASAILQIAAVPCAALFFALRNFWYFTWSGVLQILLLCLGNALVIPEYGLVGAAYVILLTRLLILVLTVGLSLGLHFKQK
jgi:stage V sporulation protein B